jgi:hypothetical protein
MKNITIELSPQEFTEILQAYQILQTFLDKVLSPNELYREKFLTGLNTAQREVETGQFEEVKTFDDFIR